MRSRSGLLEKGFQGDLSYGRTLVGGDAMLFLDGSVDGQPGSLRGKQIFTGQQAADYLNRGDGKIGGVETGAIWSGAYDHLLNGRVSFEDGYGFGDALSPWMRDLMRQIDALDLIEIYEATTCPLLVVSGARTDEYAVLFDEPGATAWTAGRAWLMNTLARLDRELPLFEHAFLDTSHDALREDPIGLRSLVRETTLQR